MLLDHISTHDSLLKFNENAPFLKQILVGGEKWLLFNNVKCKILCGKQSKPHHQPHQRLIFIQRKWYCVYGETGRESAIMSFLRKVIN